MYLLDTNMLSEIIKKMGTIPSPAIFTATICIMELRYGAMKRGNPSDFWQMIEQHILSKVRILNFSYTEALKAGELTHQLYSMGQPIGIEPPNGSGASWPQGRENDYDLYPCFESVRKRCS